MTDQQLITIDSREATTESNQELREYWINELEVAYDQALEQAILPGHMEDWLDKHNERQIDVMRRNLGIDGVETGRGKLRAKKNKLRFDSDELLSYVLVKEFAKFKSRLATIEAARNVLPPEVMDMCAKGDDDYDTLALCYAIYHHDFMQLCSVLHWDRIHKTGFARMKMKSGPRRPGKPFNEYPPFLKSSGLYFSQSIVWDKQHPVLTRKDFMGAFEICFYGWREGAGHKFFGPNNVTDLWHVKKVNPQSMVHLTEKPVELAVRAIQYSSRTGENVLDLFGGSGSTLIGCEQTGRKAFLMELDAPYCDIIVQRWEKFTGKKAERITGEVVTQ